MLMPAVFLSFLLFYVFLRCGALCENINFILKIFAALMDSTLTLTV